MNKPNSQITAAGGQTSDWLSFGERPKKDWSFMLENPGSETVTVEATLVDVDNDGVPSSDQTWAIQDLTGVTTGGLFGPFPVVRAIRIVNSGVGPVVGHVCQPS